MSPNAIILQDEKTSDCRTIAYETYRKETVVIIQQRRVDNNEWQTTNHIAIPIVMFDYIQIFRFEKALLKGSQYTLDFVTNYFREFVFDPMILEDNVRKILYDYDLKEIPLYENQEGYWRDLEAIESLWKTEKTESPVSTLFENELSTPSTPAMKNSCSIEPDSSTIATPPVGFCYAPKKRKLNNSNLFC